MVETLVAVISEIKSENFFFKFIICVLNNNIVSSNVIIIYDMVQVSPYDIKFVMFNWTISNHRFAHVCCVQSFAFFFLLTVKKTRNDEMFYDVQPLGFGIGV